MMENTLEKVTGFHDVGIEKRLDDLEKKIDQILEAVIAIKEKLNNA